MHSSAAVQWSPSLHAVSSVTLVYAHPVAGAQESSVHMFPSAQLGATPPTQVPPEQVSFVVQAFPSLHGAVLLVFTQPVTGLQASSVQGLPSSQFRRGPPEHAPSAHRSFVVHTFPSSQGRRLLPCT